MFKQALLALAATTLVASPVLSAQAQAAPPQHRTVVQKETVRGPNGRTVTRTVVKQQPQRGRVQAHRWNKGQRFDRRQATNYRVINNPRAYRLSNAPRGYHWVQSGNDAVMVAITSGLIGAVIGNAIR